MGSGWLCYACKSKSNSAFKLNLGTGGNYRVIHGLPPESSLFIKIIDPSSLPVASSRPENLRITHDRILKHVKPEHWSVVCHYDYRFERSYQTQCFSCHDYE